MKSIDSRAPASHRALDIRASEDVRLVFTTVRAGRVREAVCAGCDGQMDMFSNPQSDISSVTR